MINIFHLIDWNFWLSLYALAGLITLFILIHIGKRSEEDYADVQDNLGRVVLLSILGWPFVLFVYIKSLKWWLAFTWPYLLFIWVFSWRIWFNSGTLDALSRLSVFISRWVAK